MEKMYDVSHPALIGKKRRMNSILSDSGRAILVPLDDSLISHNDGLLDLREKVASIEKGRPNAILSYQGTASVLKDYNIPLIINLTGSTINSTHTNKVRLSSVEHALMQNAAAVAMHINISSKYESEMLKNVGQVAEKCHLYGMPLLIIAYPRSEKGIIDYNYEDIKKGDLQKYTKLVSHCVRIAFELGADMIKTQYTGTSESFEEVIAAAVNRPVFIAGGSMTKEEILFEMIHGAIKAGGAGVSIGRNVFNRENTDEIINKIRNIVFNN